jgi:DNA-directed RNA polymerase subunit omega
MRELVLEELLDKVKNRFLLTVAAARRARQIRDGAKVLIDAPEGEPPVIVALDEILEDKIRIEVGEYKQTALQEIDLKKLVIKEPEVIKAKEESKKAEKEKAEKKPAKKTTAKKGKAVKKKKKSRSMAA